MKTMTPTLAGEIKKNIFRRIILCVFILVSVFIMIIGFFLYFFIGESVHQVESISKDLTPYIVSQKIINNKYAIIFKVKEISKQNSVKIKWVDTSSLPVKVGFDLKSIFKWRYHVPVNAVDGKYYGYYVISGQIIKDQWVMIVFFIQFIFFLMLLILVFFVLYPIANTIPERIILGPIRNLTNLLRENDKNKLSLFSASHEIMLLRDHFTEIMIGHSEILKKKEILKIAGQLAHDIRSPLAAINVAVSTFSSVPENLRVIIKNAAGRINDIANNLLIQSSEKSQSLESVNESVVSPELIYVVLENIIAEKKYEHNHIKSQIKLNVSEHAYNCFSNVNLSAFKRVLSNLINNAVEAINLEGFVDVYLQCSKSDIKVIIKDNGSGIPAKMLDKVAQRGFSFGKKNGMGLGLSYAHQYAQQLGGKLLIESEEHIGTCITVCLPRCAEPDWFCGTLIVDKGKAVIILDDDPSIHSAWDHRLNFITENVIHFFSGSDLLSQEIINAGLYLIDYELLHDSKNGLDIIEELKVNSSVILVTSCFEDKSVRQRCEKLNIKIIPKPYVPYIPVILKSEELEIFSSPSFCKDIESFLP